MTDSLTVYLSGDAWNGDANATLSVNGASVGGTLDVQASNAADNVEAFTFSGNFGATPTLAVSFVNDASGGTATQDRNLYLDGVSYDRVMQLNDKQTLDYDKTVSATLTSTQPNAMRVADFANSVGVNAHLSYFDTSYGTNNGSTGNTALVASSLAYLGIDHARVGESEIPQTLAEMQTLAADGDKFDIVLPSTSSSAALASQISVIDKIAGAVAAIEGPNEVNMTSSFSWNGQNSMSAAQSYQQALDAAVRADPALKSDAIYNITLAGVGADAYQSLGNMSADATDGNMHVYFANGTPPAGTIQYNLGLASLATPSDPTAITETNYATASQIAGQVSDGVQARYDLDLLMDATKDGVAATYFYELLDERADPNDTDVQNHYGLFNADGTPKAVATAIHNLMSVLNDTGATASGFATGSLAYSVAGLPASGNSLVLEKSNGAYDLVVWAEPALLNAAIGSQLAATPRPVTVSFGGTQSEVRVFDPLAGTSAVSDSKTVSSVSVSVTDHPLVIEVEPTAVTAAATPLTVGSGSDTLALQVSEDAYQGDAQFTVSVDGQQIGGTLSATASHAAGQSNTIDVLGNFAAGSHTMTMTFLNDLYNPGVGDRNLYLNGASLDGAAVPRSGLTLLSNGSQSVGLLSTDPAPTLSVGSGPNTLALQVSEDAYQGDAQFTVSVDGKQIGGTLSATAIHAAGKSQLVDILGSFGAGAHTLGIDFVNDLYNPGVGDRNIYVSGASLNGGTVPGSALTLLSNGTQTIHFVAPASS